MFKSGADLLKFCHQEKKSIWEASLIQSLEKGQMNQKAFEEKLLSIYQVMKSAALRGKNEALSSVSGLLHGNAKALSDYKPKAKLFSKDIIDLMSMAISTSEVNASMGTIVASPTAGAAGILPACLVFYQEKYQLDDKKMLQGLLTASQVGAVIMHRANVSGAEGGCQAETGSASAMAAAALVELMGGSPEQALNAAGFAIVNILGLVCDPIGGRVEYPCFMRNANGVLNALGSAEMAMANLQTFADFDQVVAAMQEVGESLPASLRETGLGGIAKHCKTCFQGLGGEVKKED